MAAEEARRRYGSAIPITQPNSHALYLENMQSVSRQNTTKRIVNSVGQSVSSVLSFCSTNMPDRLTDCLTDRLNLTIRFVVFCQAFWPFLYLIKLQSTIQPNYGKIPRTTLSDIKHMTRYDISFSHLGHLSAAFSYSFCSGTFALFFPSFSSHFSFNRFSVSLLYAFLSLHIHLK